MLSARRAIAYTGALLLTASDGEADVTRDVVFISGQAAAGFPAGATIQNFANSSRRPWINSRGHVLLDAAATGGGVNSLNDQGIWLATRRGLVLLLRENDPVPGVPDAFVRQWLPYGITNNDEVILHVRFSGEGVSPTNDTAVCRVAPGSGLTILAREGDPVSDIPEDGTWVGFTFDTLFDNRVNEHGEALIGAATTFTPNGFWFTRGSQMIHLVSLHEQAPGAAPGTQVEQLVMLGWTDDRIGLFRTYLSGGDADDTNRNALIAFGEDGDVMIARQGSVPPGVPDGMYSLFSDGDAAGSDQTLFSAVVNAPGANDTGLWVGNPNEVRLLIRQGDQAPGLAPGRFLNSIFWQAAGPDGAGFVGNAGGGNGAFAERNGELALLCYTELPAADLPIGVLYGQVPSFGNDSPLRFADFGRAAFPNNLVGSGVPTNERFAIFQTDVAGDTRLVLRASEILATPLGARTFAQAGNMALARNGVMAIHAFLSNPSAMGIVVAHVGCPDSACDGLDLDGDCRIGLPDLAELLSGFGQAGLDLPADYDNSGQVDLQDLATLLAVFGQDCSGN